MTFAVRVLPRSSRNEIAGVSEGVLRVKLTVPPVEGAANKALVELLAKKLHVPKSRITIISGQSGRSKLVGAHGIGKEALLSLLC